MIENINQLIAHIRKNDKTPQTLLEHLNGVSQWAGQFAEKVGMQETGEILGLLHDYGKASLLFQNYLLSAEKQIKPDDPRYIDPDEMRGRVDHSTAGAQIIYKKLWQKSTKEKIGAQVLALCIASHHSGLIDCIGPDGENYFQKRMAKADENTHRTEASENLQELEDEIERFLSQKVIDQIFNKFKSLSVENKDSKETAVFKVGLLIRFLLSCLIDADRIDTADFEMPGNAEIRNYGQYHPWETLIERLNSRIAEFDKKENKNEVDVLRSQVSQACVDISAKPKGIYQLTVPTGGGKTLASLRFALHHAAKHGMERVFYIIPYTSIIDQNADEIRKILEDKNEKGQYLDRVVLEHHSNLTPEEETYRQSILAQNWDAPVVLTTQVQFLEALFGARTRGARRMHQLANSVIILDEVQTLPINTIYMLNSALRFLVETCGATAVLCTATQPPLDKLDSAYHSLTIQADQRIIQNEKELYQKLKRVKVCDKRKVGGWKDEEIADLAICQLEEKGSVLIVVNTKKSAQSLYQTIEDRKLEDLNLFHLSTNMCPAHRLKKLNEVKEKLSEQQHVICISTQLIEAGVDIDFGAVIRYLAGLDSIAQSAGRCNRHGKQIKHGNVWVINPSEQNIDRLRTIVIGTEQTERVLDEFKNNPGTFDNDCIGLDAMAAFYRYYYYTRKDEMRYNVGENSPVGRSDDLVNVLSQNTLSVEKYNAIYHAAPDICFPQAFQCAAESFRVIDSPTRGVVVYYGKEGEDIVNELCSTPELDKQYRLLKRAQKYSVNLFPYVFEKLMESGAIFEVQKGAGIFYLKKNCYDEKFGLKAENASDVTCEFP
jgi:CRISPR-associated endonuclease/helicase Cas3